MNNRKWHAEEEDAGTTITIDEVATVVGVIIGIITIITAIVEIIIPSTK